MLKKRTKKKWPYRYAFQKNRIYLHSPDINNKQNLNKSFFSLQFKSITGRKMMTATETISDSVIVPNSNNNDAFIIPIIKSALKNATIMNKNITAIPPPSLETLDISSPDEEVGDGSYLSKFYKLKQEKLANLRPLSEFFDRNRINMTSSFQVIAQRWK